MGAPWRCSMCGERFDNSEPMRSHAVHARDCDGSCKSCPVECGPIYLVEDEVLERIATLEADLARERERAEKAERERDLALAHDTQPYPTAHAYEKVCAALEKHKRLLGEADEAIRFADLIFVEESMRSTAFAELSFSNWIEHPAVSRALGQAEGEEREG